HRHDLLPPELVGDADHGEAEVLFGLAELAEQFLAELLEQGSGEAGGAVAGAGEVGGGEADPDAQLTGWRDHLEGGGVGATVLAGFIDSGDHSRLLGAARAGSILPTPGEGSLFMTDGSST